MEELLVLQELVNKHIVLPVMDNQPVSPFSEFTCYQDLEPIQQDAVRRLNMTSKGWNLAADIPGTRDYCYKLYPPQMNDAGYSCLRARFRLYTPFHFPKVQPNTNKRWILWTDLTPQRQEAAVTLGWELQQEWNERYIPNTFITPWKELSPAQRAEAEFLEFQQDTWEQCKSDPAASCTARLFMAEQAAVPVTNVRPWDSLGVGTQAYLEMLGWTTTTWNDGGPWPVGFSRPWDELTKSVQNAAEKMGYDRETWNGCPGTSCLDRYRFVQQRVLCPHGFFDGTPSMGCYVEWDMLSRRIQSQLTLLGYTQAAWDARALPDTFTLQWKELVYEEQAAATVLGFDKGTWDGCAGSEVEDKKEEVTFVKDPLRRIRMNMVISRSYTEVSSYRE